MVDNLYSYVTCYGKNSKTSSQYSTKQGLDKITQSDKDSHISYV